MADLTLLDDVLTKKKSNTSSTATAPSASNSTSQSTSRLSSLDNVLASKAAKNAQKPAEVAPVQAPVASKPSIFSEITGALGTAAKAVGGVLQAPFKYLENQPDQYEVKVSAPRQPDETRSEYVDRLKTESVAESARVSNLNKASNLFGIDYQTFTESLPFGIGEAIKEIRQDPTTAAALTGSDVLKSTPKALYDAGTGFVKAPISGALDILGIGGAKISFNIPYLGDVSNAQFKAAQRITNGEDPSTVILQEGSNAILDTLFFADIASRPFTARSTSVAKLNPEQVAENFGSKNTIGTGVPEGATPKSFRLYEKPTITSVKYTELNPDLVTKMGEQGVDLSKFDPSNPTYFKFQMEPSGQITGEVIQVKPSFFESIKGKLTGTEPVEGVSGLPAAAAGEKAGQTAPSASHDANAVLSAELSKMAPSDYDVLASKTVPVDALQHVTPVVQDNPTFSTVDKTVLNKPSSEVQSHIDSLQESYTKNPDPAVAEQIATLQSSLQAFQDATKEIKLSVQKNGENIAQLSTFEYSNGKYAYSIDGNTPSHAVMSNFNSSKLYATEAEAVAAGKADLVKWAKDQLSTAQGTDKAYLENIVNGVEKGQTPARDSEPLISDGDTLPAIEKKITDTYTTAGVGKAEEAIGKILMELELSEPGYRLMTGMGADREVRGVPSTFPKWIPEALRSKALFEKLYTNLDLANLKMPNDGKTRQRELFNLLLDEVDAELGVDTSALRKQLTQLYENSKGKNAEGGNSGTGGSEGGRTQKEAVKEAVSDKAKSIKQIAEETGIKEPNIRRILGVGAKEGTFERVEEGVYILNNGKEDIAFIHTGDAVDALPKLVAKGTKVDMVFLDIPYNTAAVKGGNRGVEYNLISTADFRKVMDAVSNIVRDDNTPVYYMFSQAPSGLKQMLKYNDVLTETGFKPIAKGDYQKLFKTGKPVTNVRGEVSKPEGILLLNKSGVFNENDAKRNLDFSLKRPQGYSTEKPAELLRSLILQGTKEGGTVLDPFAGSGVTGAEAVKANRKTILIEKNAEVAKNITKPRVEKAILSPDELVRKTEQLPAYQHGAKNASIGVFRDGTPVEEGHLDTVKPIEMPELVRLARELSGEIPKVKAKVGRKFGGQVRGVFRSDTGKIILNADIFSDPEGAAKTLAHEIGHLIDWLPDKMLARGNLLGRLQSLRKFTKSIFGGSETGLFGKEPIDLKKIRNDALRGILKEKGIGYGDYITTKSTRDALKEAVKARYTDLVEATGGIKNSTVKAELQKVSEYWKPYDKELSSPSYVSYRNSAEELYADAISVLFNSPALLEKMAPTFYKQFFEGLDTKPEVKAQYFELQALLHGTSEELFAARKADIRKGFQKAEAIQAGFAEKTALGIKAYWERLRQQLDDINYPLLKKQQDAEARGVVLPDSENVKYILQESSFADNENFLMVENIDRNVVKPIEKAGMMIDDLGEYLLLDRIQKDRADIANPFGFNPKNAAQQMAHIKALVGEDNFALLQEKAQVFHDIVFKSVEEAVAVGSYNKELFETKIKPNKDSYASFQVVDYMQDHMPATIKGQVGTLKEVANPFVSTILKTVALNRLNAYQRAKNAAIKLLQDNFPEEITETKSITTDGRLRIFKPARDRGTIEVLVDGKMQSYDVDPYIAESFQKDKTGDLNVIVSLIDKFNNQLFKPLVTTYNLGFAAAFNPKRDFTRNYKLIPNATVLNLLQAYAKSFGSAVKYSKGELDDFTRSLVESKAINAPVNDYNFDPRDDEFGRILERYGLIKKPEATPIKNMGISSRDIFKPAADFIVKTKVLAVPVVKVLEGIRFVAESLEIVSKVAGAKVRIAGGESGKELAYNLRNFTGTPNYKVRGKQTQTTNAIFIFSNIMKEGLKADFRFATDPKTRSGYWWKTVKVDLLPKFLMFLAASGLLGAALKKYFDNISEYDKSNYIIVPLGSSADGKSVYMRVPHDETGRLVSVAFWKMANMIKDGGKPKDLQDIYAVGAGQLPSVTPLIDIASAWSQYLSGRNPYDAFHGRTLIDDTTWAAGGGAALKKMVQWTTNDIGLTKFSTFDTSKQSGIETFIQIAPFFSSVIKISDYGQQEKLKGIAADQAQLDAKETLKERDIIDKYAIKARAETSTLFAVSKYQNQVINDILGHAPQSKDEQDKASAIKTKFARAVKRGNADDPRVTTLIDAPSNNQKREILKSIKSDMSTGDWSTFSAGLLQDKIVTPELLYNLK